MKQQHVDYQVVANPKLQRFYATMFRSAQHTPIMHGLIEVDVTRAREFLREHQAKTGESISFTAFLIACLAKAIDEHKAVQAFRKGSKRLILFEEVDVYTMIERDVAGQKQPTPYIVRAANRKTVHENSSRDSGRPGAGRRKRLEVASVPACLSLSTFLMGLLLDREKISTGVEEVRGDSGHHGSGHVWERCRLGHPSSPPNTHDDGGRHW